MAKTAAKERTRTPEKPESWAGSADAWKKRGGPHRLTLPSGQRVLARVLGFESMARLQGLPKDLSNAVVLHVWNRDQGGLPAIIAAEAAAGDSDPEAAERAERHTADFLELTKHIVAEALVEPKLTVDELEDVPEDDLEMLMRIVTGRQGFDAEGVRIGVEPLDAWATFCDQHRCPDGCEACVKARRLLSSIDLDEL